MKARAIAEKLGGELFGNGEREVLFPCTIDSPKKGHITFLGNKKYASYLESLRDCTVILALDEKEKCDQAENTIIVVEEPQIAFGKVLHFFEPEHKQGYISPSAHVDEKSKIAKGVSLMEFSSVAAGAEIKKGAVIYQGVHIAQDAVIGEDVILLPGVYVGRGVVIGNRTVIDAGAKIGSSGFGFPRMKDGKNGRVPQIGSVRIGEDVYIGANTTIDRGTVENTVIGDNTKIDNLVQIAHNVKIGTNCLIIAQAGIAGSTSIGDNAIVAAQAGIVGHIEIGRNAIVGAKSGVSKSIPPDVMYSGIPARDHMTELRIQAVTKRLPEIYKFINEVKKEWKKG